MNKRLTTAIIILAVIMLISTVSLVSTGIIADRIIDNAKQLQSSAADAPTLELFEDKWEKYERFLSFYTRHSEIENISESVHILDTLAEDSHLFRVECNRIIAAAEHMKNTERPYLRNIF